MSDKDLGSNRQGDLPTELVARLEVTSEGSDELDHAMSMATGILLTGVKENGEWGVKKGRWTQSLDAALALAGRVLPNMAWTVCQLEAGNGLAVNGPFYAVLETDNEWAELFEVSAMTPAIAVCAAVLKATTASAVGTSVSE